MEISTDLRVPMHEILIGPNSILEGLRAGKRSLKKLYIAKGRSGEKIRTIVQLAKEKGIPVSRVERDQLSSMSGNDRHQGVLALVGGQKYFSLEEVLEEIQGKEEPALFLLLDEIQDARNLGSILRTAETAGVDAVIIPKNRAARLGAGATKSSAGAEEYVRVVRVTNLVEAMRRMREAGIWLVGADQGAGKEYEQVDLRGPVALAIGGEGRGLRRLTRESCDILVRIPMKGRISCLNAGVAAGILVFEVLRQRKK